MASVKGNSMQLHDKKARRMNWRYGMAILLMFAANSTMADDDWWSTHMGNSAKAPKADAKSGKASTKGNKAAKLQECEKRADKAEGAKLTGPARQRFVETGTGDRPRFRSNKQPL